MNEIESVKLELQYDIFSDCPTLQSRWWIRSLIREKNMQVNIRGKCGWTMQLNQYIIRSPLFVTLWKHQQYWVKLLINLLKFLILMAAGERQLGCCKTVFGFEISTCNVFLKRRINNIILSYRIWRLSGSATSKRSKHVLWFLHRLHIHSYV